MNKSILFAVDGSKSSLQVASVLGKLLKDQTQNSILLLHCVQQLAALYPGEIAEIGSVERSSAEFQKKLGDAVLASSVQALQESGFPADQIRSDLVLGCTDPAQDILAKAEAERIRTIALGRRGRSQLQSLLLGSVSSKVAQYSHYRTVWIIDSEVQPSRKVLVAMAGVPDARALTYYATEFIAPIPHLHYTLFHIMPPIPPTFWDDGHILGPEEQKDRQSRINKWRREWTQKVEKFMDEAADSLVGKGVPEQKVDKRIVQTKEGIARDLLNEIARGRYQMVIMGKKSFHERKPFLMGSHANKVLQNIERAILCLVDAS